MRYQGQFKSIHKDKLYTVEIVTNGSSSTTTNITLGPSPFTTTMDAGTATIYSPVKYQSATVQIVSNNYHFDMYASTPKQNSVKLIDASNNVCFTGYISPNVYDAPYNFVTETWDVECVDGLSVLKNYDYTPADSSTRGFISFSKLIHNCLSKCGCYSSWYISKALRIKEKASTSSFRTFDNLFISEANFFDEDDVPMKLNEVLEEVCKFLGVVAVAEGNEVFLMDYDAIKAGTNTYNKYNISSTPYDSSTDYTYTTATATRNLPLTISKDSYSSTGTRLSLDTVYSKVTVKDSLYKVGDIIPSMFDDEDLVNVHYIDEENQNWGYEIPPGGYLQCTHPGDNARKEDDDTWFQIKARYYTNKRYIHHFFDNSTGNCICTWDWNDPDSSTSAQIPIQSPITADRAMGGLFTQYIIGSGKTLNESYANTEYDSWENYLMLTANHSDVTGRTPGASGGRGMALIQSNTAFMKPFFVSGKTKLVAQGELIITDRLMFSQKHPNEYVDVSIGYWPHTGTFVSAYNGNWWRGDTLMIQQGLLTLKTKIDIGSTSKTFDIPFYPIDQQYVELNENKKKHEIFYTSFGIQDSVTYSDKITEKGYLLNMQIDQNDIIPAKPIISLYGMDNLRLAFYGSGFPSPIACVFLKDFNIIAVDPHEGADEDVNATDTEYSVEIDSDYVTELSPITFKICTSDGKSLNYSSVAWKDGTTYHFVDEFNHSSLGSKMAASDDGASTRRAEQILCFRLVNQYSTPSKKLTINLFDDLVKPYSLVTEPAQAPDGTPLIDCEMIINTLSHDYVTDTVTCELVEKK